MYKTSNKHLNKIMQENENFFLFLFSEVPYSGWKIHISCTFRNYNLIFNIVSEYCYEKRLSFKVIKNIDLYFKNGFKNGDRSSYGKFITIYPETEESFVNHMEELYSLLQEFEGPYILTDKRYKNCKCLYYRYGNNRLTNLFDEKGNGIRVVKYSEHTYVDEPTGYYNVPDFIEDPFDNKDEASISNYLLVNYEILDGLKFSPVGGVYKALHKKTKNMCVVKEFYPHTAIMDENNDSFNLFTNEVSNLKKLKNFQFLPNYIEDFKDWDNLYLVEEFIQGKNLEEFSAENNSLVLGVDQEQNRNYIIKILKTFLNITDNIVELYSAGYILSDLSPDNILINETGVYFVDLESVQSVTGTSDIYSYTLNFFDKNKSFEGNIKMMITNLLLFCFNKKSSLFNKFSQEEILEPIIRHVPEVQLVLQLINDINCKNIEILDIKSLMIDTLNLIEKTNKFDNINTLQNRNKEGFNKDNFEKMLERKDYIMNNLENRNSIAYGTLGNLLAQKYVLNKNLQLADFTPYIQDYRTNSFFLWIFWIVVYT